MKEIIPNDPKKNARLWHALEAHTEDMVKKAEELAEEMKAAFKQEEGKQLSDKEHKERQLRNIQGVAEQSTSWAEVELFIRYQAARKEIPKEWAKHAIQTLGGLKDIALKITHDALGTHRDEVANRIHIELIRRVLGYTVWWHVWHAKGESKPKGRQG
ncbi:hypothetical protein [Thermoflexus sp.]|uniref:hypothetical protein n=1 Tax=Thermoflexus sp. TaxID=1969742 RepID=UPI002ADDC375|nr:hypothetical protein [Thermoflexus sp.]